MLYDQAQLTISYIDVFHVRHDQYYADIARDILRYVSCTMTDSAGGFYSAEDAESAVAADHPGRKKEGAFYLWTEGEIRRILSGDETAPAVFYYGVEPQGNAASDPHQQIAAWWNGSLASEKS